MALYFNHNSIQSSLSSRTVFENTIVLNVKNAQIFENSTIEKIFRNSCMCVCIIIFGIFEFVFAKYLRDFLGICEFKICFEILSGFFFGIPRIFHIDHRDFGIFGKNPRDRNFENPIAKPRLVIKHSYNYSE